MCTTSDPREENPKFNGRAVLELMISRVIVVQKCEERSLAQCVACFDQLLSVQWRQTTAHGAVAWLLARCVQGKTLLRISPRCKAWRSKRVNRNARCLRCLRISPSWRAVLSIRCGQCMQMNDSGTKLRAAARQGGGSVGSYYAPIPRSR